MYEDIISLQNLFSSWEEFLCGKRKRKDVLEFSMKLSEEIFALHTELKEKTYQHSPYTAFNISDPKPRNIHKAAVRDRLLHHAIYRVLYPVFDKKFIYDSYSCRLGKGTHKAMNRFRMFCRKESRNNTRTVWVLKCDIRKFFASIDHGVLKRILKKHITDINTFWLLSQVIDSFNSIYAMAYMRKVGLPLGNLTSQLLVNVYMNEFDQYVKHVLKKKYYIRYADDFVILSHDKKQLEEVLPIIENFLRNTLKLSMHPQKVSIATLASGVDFLGWVHFPSHRVLRTTTKNRMLKNLSLQIQNKHVVNSYLGLLQRGNTQKLVRHIHHITQSRNLVTQDVD
jgi:retron-type reverse transcriptase